MPRPYQEQFHLKAMDMINDCGSLSRILDKLPAAIASDYHLAVELMSEANFYASKLAADLDVGELAVRAVIES